MQMMRGCDALHIFAFILWNVPGLVSGDHYYCSIIRNDALVGHVLRIDVTESEKERGQHRFPHDTWTGTQLAINFPSTNVHNKICLEMKATALRNGENSWDLNPQLRDMNLASSGHVSMYRAAHMKDRWTGTTNLLHGVFCFKCRCHPDTPFPPASSKTLDDIKFQLDNYVHNSVTYRTWHFLDTWDGGGDAPRVLFADAPESQKSTMLGSETMILLVFRERKFTVERIMATDLDHWHG